jgi:RNA polymerase sigma factor (sigma-70 family)
MPDDSDIPPDGFDEILDWLDPDRERAAQIYEELRQRLIKIFGWNGCADPEGMADETFDRVAKKIHDARPTYKGNPRLFFYGFANNLVKEYRKKLGLSVSLDDDFDRPAPEPEEEEDEAPDVEKECFHACLQKLSRENRDLILSYYAEEKQAKINHRKDLARQLGVTMTTLRVRMARIRTSIEECVARCVAENDGGNETD